MDVSCSSYSGRDTQKPKAFDVSIVSLHRRFFATITVTSMDAWLLLSSDGHNFSVIFETLILIRTSLQNFQLLLQLIRDTIEIFQKAQQLLSTGFRPASMLMMAHLSNYCNFYVNKMFVLISSQFLIFF